MNSILERLTTLDGLDVQNKCVLVRCDLNVPLIKGEISDETRIKRLCPTIRELSQKGARIILLSHLGRPTIFSQDFSLRQILPALQRNLKPIRVSFSEGIDTLETEKAIEDLAPGDVLLLENLRFSRGEEENDPVFAQKIAALGDIYINDAFSVSHRAHASISALPHLMAQKAIGRLVEEELRVLDEILRKPRRPLMAIVGGAKIRSKLPLLDHLACHADILVLGGAMAVALMRLLNPSAESSPTSGMQEEWAKKFMQQVKAKGCDLVLPIDVIVKSDTDSPDLPQCVLLQDIPEGWEVMDIGPLSQQNIILLLQTTRTVVWNGPLGAFEEVPFDKGTSLVAQEIAKKTDSKALVSVAGGGDTGAALIHARVASHFTYLSAAGGAFLEYLEGKPLPGLQELLRGED